MFDAPATDTATLPANLQDLTAALNAGGEYIGSIVYWSLSSADVKRSVLETRWLAAGLDKDFLPLPMTAEKAFTQATQQSTDASASKQGTWLRPTIKNKTHVVYAVVEEGHDAEGNYFSNQRARVTLDRATGTVTTDNPDNQKAKSVIEDFQRYLDLHTSRDIMMMMLKAMKAWNAVMLRPTGGFYWVPHTLMERVRAMKGVIESLGGSMVFTIPVHASPEGNASIGAAAVGSIEAELKGLQEEIDGWMANPDGAYAAVMERRIGEFEPLRDKANLYRSILQCTVEGLEQQIEAMTGALQSMIAAKQK